MKEPHVCVRSEHIDVTERRISQTRNRAAVVQKLADFVAAFSHHVKPPARDVPQFTWVLLQPRIDRGIALDSSVESQQLRLHRGGRGYFSCLPPLNDRSAASFESIEAAWSRHSQRIMSGRIAPPIFWPCLFMPQA